MSLSPRIDRLDRNLLINGNFDFWQRGTSGITSNRLLADRWIANGSVTSYSQEVGGPNSNSQFFARTGLSSGALGIFQRIESNFTRQIVSDTVTFSFWAKLGSGTGSVFTFIRIPSVADNYTSSSVYLNALTGTVTTTWTKFTITITVTNDMRSRGFSVSPYVSVSSSNTLDIAQCVLLEGTHPNPSFCLAGKTYADELGLCQRYYEKSYNLNTAPGTALGAGRTNWQGAAVHLSNSSGNFSARVDYKTRKRTSLSSITLYNPNTGATGSARDASDSSDISITGLSVGDNQANIVESLVGIASRGYYYHWAIDAEI